MMTFGSDGLQDMAFWCLKSSVMFGVTTGPTMINFQVRVLPRRGHVVAVVREDDNEPEADE